MAVDVTAVPFSLPFESFFSAFVSRYLTNLCLVAGDAGGVGCHEFGRV
jgi:hypothetical protein